MKVLIDTDIWIDFFKNKNYAIELIGKLYPKEEIASSVLTITELRAGWTDEQAEKRIEGFYKLSTIVSASNEIAEHAGKFIKQYSQKGISLPTVDTIIGVTAIENNYQLATRNKKDFPMPEIKFFPIES